MVLLVRHRENEEVCWNGKEMSEEYIKHGLPSCWAGRGSFRLIEEGTANNEKKYRMSLS